MFIILSDTADTQCDHPQCPLRVGLLLAVFIREWEAGIPDSSK